MSPVLVTVKYSPASLPPRLSCVTSTMCHRCLNTWVAIRALEQLVPVLAHHHQVGHPDVANLGQKKVGYVSNQIVGMSGQCCLVQTFSTCEPVRWTQRCKNTRLQILPRASSCPRGPSTLPTSRRGCTLEGPELVSKCRKPYKV